MFNGGYLYIAFAQGGTARGVAHVIDGSGYHHRLFQIDTFENDAVASIRGLDGYADVLASVQTFAGLLNFLFYCCLIIHKQSAKVLFFFEKPKKNI